MFRCLGSFKKDQNGAVIVLVAILLVVFLGIAALAIDVYHLFVVRNELQNAADAGALAGAKVLYYDYYNDPADPDDDDKPDNDPANDPPSAELAFAINPGANIVAYNTALQNISENIAVEVNDPTSNSGDVQRGHWSFSAEQFDANDSLEAVDIGSYTTEELDDPDRNKQGGDISFINAVKVVARRQDKPAASFFAQIFGFEDFGLTAEAVAYLGFSGKFNPGDLDQPIAICLQSITDDDGNLNCNMGRMLNSGSDVGTANTGAWTNFTQPCSTTTPVYMRELICGSGNPTELNTEQGIGGVGGVQDNVFRDFLDCWEANTNKTKVWNMTLPVVDCPGNNVSNCPTLIGAVNVDVIWVMRDNDSDYSEVPREMEVPGEATPWTCDADTPGFDCWKSFVGKFNLANVDGPPKTDDEYKEMYQKKNIFFLPHCQWIEPTGITGGPHLGVLAKYPVLVK